MLNRLKGFLKTKQGQMGQLAALAVGVATLAITLTVTFLIMSQGKQQIVDIEGLVNANASECQKSLACNSTSTLQSAVDDIPGWIPLVIIASIGVILLGLVRLFRSS